MKKLLLAAALFLAPQLFVSLPAIAQPLALVELYTSQGCNSCPPADALLETLAKEKDVLALSLHVDYWDYLGWKDSFSSPWATARQRGYAKTFASASIYTPQMVVGGLGHAVGSNPSAVATLLAKARATAKVDIGVRPQGIDLPARAGAKADVLLVRYSPEQSVAIARGENAGNTIRYVNVVREISRLAVWNGEAVTLDLPAATGDERLAVVVQTTGQGPVLGAAIVPKPGA
jgi:hypothetical protein